MRAVKHRGSGGRGQEGPLRAPNLRDGMRIDACGRGTRRGLLPISVLLVGIPVTFSGLGALSTPLAARSLPAGARVWPVVSPGLVRRVVDGDTLHVAVGAVPQTVRLIGVDAPERGQPFAAEAARFVRTLVAGRTVWLEGDVQSHDRFARRLAYVWTAPPRRRDVPEVRRTMLNARLLLEGYAVLLTVPPNVRYVDLFRAFQQEARETGRGVWARAERAACDPAYPDVCIPPPPPDLDCPEIPYRRFRVLPPDPHRFDGDRDGIGCER
ncbi:MAG: thermonuclease family protein [Armatimonadota bacterium]|nr:thermonuclease family protein [Armatimonadota bacterium]MDR7574231.1 thermonuclease family protein [Armatimonadota bacterium]